MRTVFQFNKEYESDTQILIFLYHVCLLSCRDGLEDPVEDQGMVSQQLDQVR